MTLDETLKKVVKLVQEKARKDPKLFPNFSKDKTIVSFRQIMDSPHSAEEVVPILNGLVELVQEKDLVPFNIEKIETKGLCNGDFDNAVSQIESGYLSAPFFIVYGRKHPVEYKKLHDLIENLKADLKLYYEIKSKISFICNSRAIQIYDPVVDKKEPMPNRVVGTYRRQQMSDLFEPLGSIKLSNPIFILTRFEFITFESKKYKSYERIVSQEGTKKVWDDYFMASFREINDSVWKKKKDELIVSLAQHYNP